MHALLFFLSLSCGKVWCEGVSGREMEQQAAEELQSVLSCADPLREQSLSYLLGMFCECLEVRRWVCAVRRVKESVSWQCTFRRRVEKRAGWHAPKWVRWLFRRGIEKRVGWPDQDELDELTRPHVRHQTRMLFTHSISTMLIQEMSWIADGIACIGKECR